MAELRIWSILDVRACYFGHRFMTMANTTKRIEYTQPLYPNMPRAE